MTDDLVKRLREVAIEKQSEAWGRVDGGQDCSISAMLAEECADRIEAQAAEIERLRGERERLALAICGGEDAPGYANAQTVETLIGVAEENRRFCHSERDRANSAESDAANARKVVRQLRDRLLRMDALLREVPGALSASFNAGREEGEGGSIRRQAKHLERVEALRAAIAKHDSEGVGTNDAV